jgi:electron transport complex protein RnfD
MLFGDLIQAKAELAGPIAGLGWDLVNLAFLAGGIWLLRRRIFTWHAPVGMLAALAICAALGFDEGSSSGGGSVLFHLFSGATMFGAFFIITDPVSSAVSNKGRLIFGAMVGILVYLIRVHGNYPDAVAFGVLLLNFAAPLIDQYTQPRVYGTKKVEVDE